MPTTFATFERLKEKGLAAYKAGEYSAAKSYLVQAAESMVGLAESAPSETLRRQHEALARELMELAKSCDQRRGAARPAAAREEDGRGGNADDWVVREKPSIRFDDIAGLDDVKQEIRLKMIYPAKHPELASRYGVSSGGGILLYGPPGTGKTMIARAVATEIDATMFVVSPAQILSKWVGEAEQNVKKLFDAAKAEPRSIIFLDEIEALVPRRRDSSSSVMTRLVPQILQELEGFDRKAQRALLFVGATNEPWSLDPAVMRPGRFDAKVYVPLPDAPARLRLLELCLGKRPLADDVALPELVARLDGYSGADIKAVCERAATIPFLAAVAGQEPRPVGLADIEAALQEVRPSVRKADLARFDEFARLN
ncbi:MAG: ATP-binding protein [Phycisphaerae bacterium]